MYLVDTNVLSELPKRAPDPAVIAWFSAQESIAISAITVEEIAFGVARAPLQQAEKLRLWFEKLLAVPPSSFPSTRKSHIPQGDSELRSSMQARSPPKPTC